MTDIRPGDEVFGSSWTGSLRTTGTFAELTVAPASMLVRKPAGLSFEEAAASVMSGLTALIAMRDVGRAGPGTRVLINGASGGVGTLAVQIARTLGAEVTGVCSAANHELVRSLGAEHVVDYARDDFTRGERRYDVVLDNVMNHAPSETARVLSPTGTLIPNSVGNTGGAFAGLPRMARASLLGKGSTDVRFVTCVVNRENLTGLATLLASGDVRVVVDRVYPLKEAGRAVARMFGHRARGKVVIAVGDEAGATGGNVRHGGRKIRSMKRFAVGLMVSLSLVLPAGCGGSSDSEAGGPTLTGYGATRDDFLERKRPDPDNPDGCCFLPEQDDGSNRYNAVTYDDDDRVISYEMAFGPTIRLSEAENVIAEQLPPDATRVWTIPKRNCKLVQYRSALIRETLAGGPWDILVTLSTADGAEPYDDLSISDIEFVNNEPRNRAVEC